MKTFELRRDIWIPRTLTQVFQFFSNANNLDLLTPKWLHFRILTPLPIVMAEGTEIDYFLRLHGFPLRWKSRITKWNPPYFFRDEQVQGPYRNWLHEHHFRPRNGGILVEDCVRYSVWGGSLMNRFFVKSDLEQIFDYRRQQLSLHFSSDNDVFKTDDSQLLDSEAVT